jgi:acetoin utilization deacetylase AcuC-like enzyme
MRVVYSATHQLHDPEHDVQAGVAVHQLERPARVERILEALVADPNFVIGSPTEHGLAPIEAVHAAGLVGFMMDAWASWRAAQKEPEIIPDTFLHPGLRAGMESQPPRPGAPIARSGYWCFDTGTPIGPGTFEAARGAVDVALTAADLVLARERVAYGLCRPPGHHAAHSVYGGFCFFNNGAIAAEYLARQTGGKVAVLDLDYHHGNGTQQIFYARDDVLYVSLHADPVRAYPYYTGYTDETGVARGRGTTLNLPLPVGTTNDQYLSALDRALQALTRFAPAITVISLGIDTYERDPLGDFRLTMPVYGESGRRVAALAGPLVILQEGGYYLPHLGENVRHFLLGALSQIS